MANTIYNGNTTKVHWAGANSDVDQHLEIYQGEVDTRFQYQAIFLSLSTQRSVADRSNTYRIDRMNTTTVKSRKSGQSLDSQKVTNEKLVITVDTVLYIRNPIDYQDDWTAPDWLREIGVNNGSQFAEVFDGAHIIQLIKARSWTAPAHLKPAFSDGVEIATTFKSAATAQVELEANAISIKNAHKKAIDLLIKRKVPLTDMVTLADVDVFSALLEHPKLLNMDVAGGDKDGDYNGRRVVRLNGVPIIENTEFPKVVNVAGTNDHVLGTAFNVTAADLKCKMVVFSKSKTLVTIEAKPFTSRVWDDQREFCNVLDCYAMYNVAQRRPDTAVVISMNEPA